MGSNVKTPDRVQSKKKRHETTHIQRKQSKNTISVQTCDDEMQNGRRSKNIDGVDGKRRRGVGLRDEGSPKNSVDRKQIKINTG